uniref:DUF3398 domain-containing protein n=1 Tax=Anisakis simplex TaxID=6269 RepID=A0A0M3JK98_ANISI
LYYSQSESRKPFVINPETGELKPSPFVRFDREQRSYEEVTVKPVLCSEYDDDEDVAVNRDMCIKFRQGAAISKDFSKIH